MNAEQARDFSRAILDDQDIVGDNVALCLDTLESFECWHPFFLLLGRAIDRSQDPLPLLVRMASVQARKQEDLQASIATCLRLIQREDLSFDQFYEKVANQVLPPGEWGVEAEVLQGVVSAFRKAEDKVACLERISFILEKKTNDDVALSQTFEHILKLDGQNVKALRYFKLVHTQNREWQDAVRVLLLLLSAVSRDQEIFRYGQELAALYVYQLDKPQEALAALDRYCTASPLDTSTIRYEANEALGNWSTCLTLLEEMQTRLQDPRALAVATYKEGVIRERLGDVNGAKQSYQKSMEFERSFLEPVEKLIHLELLAQSWERVVQLLEELYQRTEEPELAGRVQAAKGRLQEALEDSI